MSSRRGRGLLLVLALVLVVLVFLGLPGRLALLALGVLALAGGLGVVVLLPGVVCAASVAVGVVDVVARLGIDGAIARGLGARFLRARQQRQQQGARHAQDMSRFHRLLLR